MLLRVQNQQNQNIEELSCLLMQGKRNTCNDTKFHKFFHNYWGGMLWLVYTKVESQFLASQSDLCQQEKKKKQSDN